MQLVLHVVGPNVICETVMGIHTNQRLLEENIEIKKENVKVKKEGDGLLSKVISLFSSLDKRLQELSETVKELKDSKQTVVVQSSSESTISPIKEDVPRTFIPSVDTEGMTVQASKPKSRKRTVDVLSSVDQLSKLHKLGENNDN